MVCLDNICWQYHMKQFALSFVNWQLTDFNTEWRVTKSMDAAVMCRLNLTNHTLVLPGQGRRIKALTWPLFRVFLIYHNFSEQVGNSDPNRRGSRTTTTQQSFVHRPFFPTPSFCTLINHFRCRLFFEYLIQIFDCLFSQSHKIHPFRRMDFSLMHAALSVRSQPSDIKHARDCIKLSWGKCAIFINIGEW